MAQWAGLPRRLGANAVRVFRRAATRAALGSGGVWLKLRLGPSTGEQRRPSWRLGSEAAPSLSLLESLRVLERAGSDPRIEGVLLRIEGSLSGWSGALALRRAVEALRGSGRRVVVWAEGLDAEGYLVASAADRIWLPESGSLLLVGLRTEQLFLRDLLGQLDVRADVVRIGDYKTAGELLTRGAMSEEQRQQLEAWLDDLYRALVDAIASGRGLERSAVEALIDTGPHPARAAAQAGLVDRCLYPDEMEEELEKLSTRPPAHRMRAPRVRALDAGRYLAWVVSDCGWRPLAGDLPRLAYVVAQGTIHRGSGLRGVAAESLRRLLDGLARDSGVRGVVLRIDSPGGEGVASDLLHRAIRQLAREKPVVVSMGDVAASGGYYLAAGADAILAEVGTLTGSIGVVGGKLDLGGLYRRLGVAKDAVERGARAGMLSEARGFTPDERGAVRREMEAVYDVFLERVAEGRDLPRAAVERLARGRVWSGSGALANGLVDALGGPLEALREVRHRSGLAEREPVLLELHPARPQLPVLRALLGTWLGGGR